MKLGASPGVLVIDDDPGIRLLFQTALEKLAVPTFVASTKEAALDLIDSREIAVVILDHYLGSATGQEVISEIRKRPFGKAISVILVTGSDKIASARSAIASGADDFLFKPVDIMELTGRVQARLRLVDAVRLSAARSIESRVALASSLLVLMDRLDGCEPEGLATEITNALISHEMIWGCAIYATHPDGGSWLLSSRAKDEETFPRRTESFVRERLAVGPSTFGSDERLSASGAVVPLEWGDSRFGVLEIWTTDANLGVNEALSVGIEIGGTISRQLYRSIQTARRMERDSERARKLLNPEGFLTYFQPVVDIFSGKIVGFEALTRFADGTPPDGTPPDERIAEAHVLGCGKELEEALFRRALEEANSFIGDCWLFVNLSPSVLMQSEIIPGMARDSPRKLVLEITEHEPVGDYGSLQLILDQFSSNTKVAVDDAGAGFASLQHVLLLRPALVKLDRVLIADVDQDPVRQGLVAGVSHFGKESGFLLLAEGVEREAERDVLASLGVTLAQGYLFGRPMPPSYDASLETTELVFGPR